MTASEIVIEGPSILDWLAFAAGCMTVGAVIAWFLAWACLRFPTPSIWPTGRWRALRSVAAVVRVTWRQLDRRIHKHRPIEEEPTLHLPRVPAQRAGGGR